MRREGVFMRRIVRFLSKIFCFGFFAMLGVAAGAAVFSSLMVVCVEGTAMLPQLEPGDRLLVLRDSPVVERRQLQVGDLVVYEAPYFTVDGEGLEKVLRVTGTRGSWLRLNCDVKTVQNQEIMVTEEEILGKVLLKLPRLEIF